jgi:hypothetical protein
MDIIGESNNMPLIWEMARENELGVAGRFCHNVYSIMQIKLLIIVRI